MSTSSEVTCQACGLGANAFIDIEVTKRCLPFMRERDHAISTLEALRAAVSDAVAPELLREIDRAAREAAPLLEEERALQVQRLEAERARVRVLTAERDDAMKKLAAVETELRSSKDGWGRDARAFSTVLGQISRAGKLLRASVANPDTGKRALTLAYACMDALGLGALESR